MTYVDAVDYCKSHNTTICESLPGRQLTSEITILDSPGRFDDIIDEFEKRNMTKGLFIIWTDFQRVKQIKFRSEQKLNFQSS